MIPISLMRAMFIVRMSSSTLQFYEKAQSAYRISGELLKPEMQIVYAPFSRAILIESTGTFAFPEKLIPMATSVFDREAAVSNEVVKSVQQTSGTPICWNATCANCALALDPP